MFPPMGPTSQNVYLGTTWVFPIQCYDPVSGMPQDLSGGGVVLRVASASVLVLDISLDAGPDFPTGKGLIYIAAPDQTGIVARPYEMEVISIDSNGVETLQVFGPLVVAETLFAQFPFTPPVIDGGVLDFSKPGSSALIGH